MCNVYVYLVKLIERKHESVLLSPLPLLSLSLGLKHTVYLLVEVKHYREEQIGR